MTELAANDLRAIFARLNARAAEQKDYLISLDAAMGDGDLGLTMAAGFAKANEVLAASPEPRLGKLLRTAGEAFAEAAPSTMGTLLASAFLGGGKVLGDVERAGTPELAQMFSGMVDGIAARGKSKVGEKTILDVFVPVVNALQSAGQKALTAAVPEAVNAANQGYEAAKQMIAMHGRAAFYGDKSVGQPDPGCAVGLLIVNTIADYVTRVSG